MVPGLVHARAANFGDGVGRRRPREAGVEQKANDPIFRNRKPTTGAEKRLVLLGLDPLDPLNPISERVTRHRWTVGSNIIFHPGPIYSAN